MTDPTERMPVPEPIATEPIPPGPGRRERRADAGVPAAEKLPTPTTTPAPPATPAPATAIPSRTEGPSEDVATAETSAMPGEHRGGFHREFTEPVPITASVHTEPEVRWAPAPERLPRSAPWALVFAILGLIVSFLVGWGFLIGLVGAGLAIAALRRPWESRATAVWALCLSVVSVLYSAGWLWWASTQGPLFG